MGPMIAAFLTFLLTHADLVNAIWEALDSGTSKEALLKAIRESQIAASEAMVEADLGPRPAK